MLADARLALGDEESAALELRAAHETFERLGAVVDDRKATAALRALAGAVDMGASDRRDRPAHVHPLSNLGS